MSYKTHEQIEKSITAYRIVSVVMLGLIMFIGANNIETTNAAKHYETKLEEQKAKTKVFQDELTDIKQSGTCLQRISALEQ